MKGLYLYCIGDKAEKSSLGKIGIKNEEIISLPYRDLSVVFQEFPLEDNECKEAQNLIAWVQIYERVINLCWGKFGSVLPIKFGTVIKAEPGRTPKEILFSWLEEEQAKFQQKLPYLKEKAEYGVQIFWNKEKISALIEKENQEIKELKAEIGSKSSGIAFLLKQKLENRIKNEMENYAKSCLEKVFPQIKQAAVEIKIEPAKKDPAGRMTLFNLSCLIDKDKPEHLKALLEEFEKESGFEVRLVGPFPPYSFV